MAFNSYKERQLSITSPALIERRALPTFSDYVVSHSMHGRPISPKVAPMRCLGQLYASPHPSHVLPNVSTVASSLDNLAQNQQIDHAAYFSSNGYEGNTCRPTSSGLHENQDRLVARLESRDSLRGRQALDNYLLAVQPEKFVHYTASCFAPKLPLRLDQYPPLFGNHLNNDEDVYSNYRRAKARRIEANELHHTSLSSDRNHDKKSHQDGNQTRERKQRLKTSQDCARSSPLGTLSNGVSTGLACNRLQTSNDMDGCGDNKIKKQDAKQPDAEEDARHGISLKENAKNLKKEGHNYESDEDSELGSLCVDVSDDDDDKKPKNSTACASTVIDDSLPGMIFGCSSATFHECMRLRLFGLPAKNKSDVMRIKPGAKVFLFNFDTKELSGIFEATSNGGWQIEPDAFHDFGRFPSQVEVCCVEQCPNVPQSLFRPLIKDNYVSQTKFKFDLNSKQVRDLIKLFRKAASERARRQTNLEEQFFIARSTFDNYYANRDQQQTLFRNP